MGDVRDILIKTAQEGEGTTIADNIKDGLKSSFPDNNFEVLRIDKVGPKS